MTSESIQETTVSTSLKPADARVYFPRGLVQPEGRFRFALDALLLSSFAAPLVPHADAKKRKTPPRILDLGCGCGVIGLGLLLALQDGGQSDAKEPESLQPHVLALDLDPAMAQAARVNADLLGFGSRLTVVEGDVRQIRELEAIGPEQADLVVCNPPYRVPGEGRQSASSDRAQALFENQGALADFLAAAAYAVKNRAPACFILPAGRLPEALVLADSVRLTPKRILPVHSRRNEPAKLILMHCLKNGGAGCELSAPLYLYAGRGENSHLSRQALAFCPFLACNAG